MARDPFYPDPPHLTASVYLDRLGDEEGFTQAFGVLEAAGASPSGHFEFVRAPAFPSFEYHSDLARDLEEVAVKAGAPAAAWFRSRPREVRVLKATFDLPGTDLAVLEYDIPGYPDDAGGPCHPVMVATSGDLVSTPPFVKLTREERRRREVSARTMVGVFRELSERLDPLYGAIAAELSLPVPRTLSSVSRMGLEIFVSSRLLAADPALEVDLRRWYSVGALESWKSGLYASGWAPFNSQRRSVEEPEPLVAWLPRRLAAAVRLFRSPN